MSVPHSLPCHHPIHCNHGGLERFWKRLQRRRERGRESGRKGRTALNLICATDRPTVDTEKEAAERGEGGGVIYPAFSRLGFLAVLREGESSKSESVFGESTRAKSSVPRPNPGRGGGSHATARNFSDGPLLRDKPNLCQSRVCRPLSFCPQKEERG